jgi:hypothetical protein
MAYRPLWWMPVDTYARQNMDDREWAENRDDAADVAREASRTRACEMFARWLRDAKGARLPEFLTARR